MGWEGPLIVWTLASWRRAFVVLIVQFLAKNWPTGLFHTFSISGCPCFCCYPFQKKKILEEKIK